MAEPAPTDGPARAGARVGEFFSEHGRMVYALCRLILRDGVEAEDAAQQTFLSAYRALLRGGGPEQPAAWLATIARNECRARIARRTPATFPIADADGQPAADPQAIADRQEEIEALCGAIAELPQTQREAIVLREFYGLSYREVAAALGLSGAAVESALFKSRRRLQDRLRSLRTAANLAAVPVTLRDSLTQLIPGFAQTGGAAAATVTASKLALPVTIKAAGVVVAALAVGGTMTVASKEGRHAPIAAHAPATPASPQPAAHATRGEISAPAHQIAFVTRPTRTQAAPVPAFAVSSHEQSREQEHNDRGKESHTGDQGDHERAAKPAGSGDEHAGPSPSDEGNTVAIAAEDGGGGMTETQAPYEGDALDSTDTPDGGGD